MGFGAPGKQSGGLFSAENGRQPRGVMRSGSDSVRLLRTVGRRPCKGDRQIRRGRGAKRQPCGLFVEDESEAEA